MSDSIDACHALAAVLAAVDDPAPLIPSLLPCPPLQLLIALHQEVIHTMLSDLAHARRAAVAAHCIAKRYPDDSLVQAQAHWTQGSAILYVPDYNGSLAHYDAALEWYECACQEQTPALPERDVR